MPKQKTHRGAAKRLKLTGSGKIMRKRAYNSHLAEHKPSRRKRRLGREVLVAGADARRARRMLGV